MNFFRDPDLIATARTSRGRILAGGAFLIGRSAFGVCLPWLVGRTMDLVFKGAAAADVAQSVGILLLVSLATAVCQYWMRWLIITASRDFELTARNSLFTHLTTLAWPFFNKSRTGDLMSRLTSDIEGVRMGAGPGVMYLVDTALRTTGVLIIMLTISVPLTICVFVPLALMFAVIRGVLRRIHDLSLKVQDQQAVLSSRAQESFSGARVIKAFAREAGEEATFRADSDHYVSLSNQLATAKAGLTGFIETMGTTVLALVLLVGGWKALAGTFTIGSVGAFIGYLQMLVWPMIALGWVMSLWQRAEASEGRLHHLRAAVPDITSPTGAPGDRVVRGDLEFRNLTFRHADSTEAVLTDVSLAVPAGSSLGIVGRTGSAKSTLINLVPRLLDPPPGTVFVDGTDVRAWSLDALRRGIGMVPQETFLFSDTLANNVAFGVDHLAADTLQDVVHRSCLDEAIAGFPDGLATAVGERGVTLSGGQRQRTAIARALAVDPRILILDDCLSAVDTETEARILARLAPVMRSRTTVLVTHRVTAVRDMDRIIVLDDGRIAEQGTHAQLLAADGLYAELVRLQQMEAELEPGA